jgi:hypothetical protein
VLFYLHCSSPAFAHSDHASDNAQLTLYRWASALQHGNVEVLNTLSAEDFKGPYSLNKKAFVAAIAKGDFRFSLNFELAEYHHHAGTVKARYVTVSPIKGTSPQVYSLQIDEAKTGWKVSAMTQAKHFLSPEQFPHKRLPGQLPTITVNFSLQNSATAAPEYARVRITDSKGDYWPPFGHQKHIFTGVREDIGGDVKLGDATYAYVRPDFSARLPIGKYVIEAVKSNEFVSTTVNFEVKGVSESPISVKLDRWVNMAAEGWYSGDTHVHYYDAENALLEMQAEDLNVVNVLATQWGELITEATQVTGAPSSVSLPDRVVYFNEETRHGYLGHTILHPIKKLVYPLAWGDSYNGLEGVPGGGDYPTMAHQADKAHAQGALVTWAHFPQPAGELAVDVALGKIDSIDLFTWGDAFAPTITTWAVDRKVIPGPVAYWYKFLNTGFQVPVTAGTDKMYNTQVMGAVRTYANTGSEAFDYKEWIEAIRQGRTFVTSGPLLSLKVNGQDIGSEIPLDEGDEVLVEAEVKAPIGRYPWDKFEIVKNGKVIAESNNPNRLDVVKLSIRLKLNESAWIAARVYSNQNSEPLPVSGKNYAPAMAHTSPIYLKVPESRVWSIEDAAFLEAKCDNAIEWAATIANYHNEEERREVVALFRRAKRIYSEGGGFETGETGVR